MKRSILQEQYQNENFLLSALRQSDRKAYSCLFRKYYPMLCAYCHKFISLEDSEEIVQDVLFWLWESRKELVIEKSLSQYLFKIIYNRAINKIASLQAKNKADTVFFEQMQDMLQDTDYYQIIELRELLKKAINKLPDSYREAFVMHRFQHKTYKEIAEQVGVSSKTIDYRIQQALNIFRKELKDYLPLLYFIHLV